MRAKFSNRRKNTSVNEQGIRDSVQMWRAGDVLVMVHSCAGPMGPRCHKEQLFLHCGNQKHHKQILQAAAVFPTHARQKTCTGYELQLTALHLSKEALPSLLPPFPQWGGHEQSQRNPTAEEGIKFGSLRPWWCAWTTKAELPLLLSPPLLTTNLIQEVSSPPEQETFLFWANISELQH